MNKRLIGISLKIVLILIGILFSACNKSIVQNDLDRTKDLESLEKYVPMPESNDYTLVPVPLPSYNKNEVNRKNFEKILKGMTEFEVEYMFEGLGEQLTIVEDYEKEKEIYRLDAPDGKGKILITFQNGKLSEKEAVDLK